jgi:hypothetical protein
MPKSRAAPIHSGEAAYTIEVVNLHTLVVVLHRAQKKLSASQDLDRVTALAETISQQLDERVESGLIVKPTGSDHEQLVRELNQATTHVKGYLKQKPESPQELTALLTQIDGLCAHIRSMYDLPTDAA